MTASIIDMYSTRNMLNVVRTIKSPFTFFRDTFFTQTNQSMAETIEFDIVKGKRKMAPFVHPLRQGVVMTREGYETKTFKPAYLKPKRVAAVTDLLKRQPGETIYDEFSIPERAAKLMVQDLAEIDEYILRREEWMCAKALMTGQIPVVGEGVSYTIDLLWDTDLQFTDSDMTDQWDQTATAKPLKDLDMMAKVILQKSGINPNIVVMALDVWDAFIGCTAIQTDLDKLHYRIGEIDRQAIRSGAQFRGVFGGYQVWTYLEWYIDDNGDEQELMPAKKILLGSTAAQCVKHYGAIMDIEAPGGAPVRMFPKAWTKPDPSGLHLLVQSAPLPAVHEPDAFAQAQVIA